VFFLLLFLVVLHRPAFAQRTTVKPIGGGSKMEFDYNAADQVVETRTINPDGKLLQKVDYEYLPGFLAAQQTTINYWPENGQPHTVTRVTYDLNSNFTGEFAQIFDLSGKQTMGHKLSHDPMTNVYTCADWNVAAQKYLSVECPSSEESKGAPEPVKKFTYEEVVHHLEAARRNISADAKPRPMRPPAEAQSSTATRELAIVLPAHVRPGERISGIVTENPSQFEGMPEITVIRLSFPLQSTGEASGLRDWLFEAPGEKPQPALGPVTFVVPGDGSGISLTLRQAANPAKFATLPLQLPASAAGAKLQPRKSFQSPALCVKGQLCPVQGSFSGDSSKTFAAVEDRAATIVAENSEAAYITIPEATESGSRPMFLAEGSKVVALPLTVASFFIRNDERSLEKGQTLITFPTLQGPGEIPDALWRPGNYPPGNLAEARALIPGFQLPPVGRKAREKREATEKKDRGSKASRKEEENKGGEILLVVKNMSPEQIALRGTQNQMLVFHLTDESFSRGDFKYDLVVESLQSGKFNIKGYVIPFLAPLTGQEFTVKPLPGPMP
jgi:hypothetical protein